MSISKSNLTVQSISDGATTFTGESRIYVTGSYVTIKGFQFLNGDIGTSDVIKTTGSHNLFTQINIKDYTSYKYLVISESSQYVDVTYCNFENRINLDDKNILSILVDDTNPGYHKVQYCSFQNFSGTGNDQGIEPIRIGLSSQGDFISASTIEYCYFTQCNGDGEIISNKARQNVFRYNTFEDNPYSELVLRHGSEAVVYGNFFLNGMGGVRIREGQDHVVYNNYFSGLTSRSIYLQNEDSDPLDNILVAFNTIVNSADLILGPSGDDPPTNVVLANNIFSEPSDDLFTSVTGTETWIGNISSGTLGITRPDGLTDTDPKLSINSSGYYALADDSPAIDAALSGYNALPTYAGLVIDNDILFDVIKSDRPSTITSKDIGAEEYNEQATVAPIATPDNTGPNYLNEITINVAVIGEGEVTLSSTGPYMEGTVVEMTAIASSGYEFSTWTGDASGTDVVYSITMDKSKSVTANFVPTGTPSVTLTVNTVGSGTVTLSPDQEEYVVGTIVTLTAIPDTGYSFVEWTGDLTETSNPTTITMSTDMEVIANFESPILDIGQYDFSPNAELTVYPNPMHNVLNVSFRLENNTSVQLDVIDNMGKVVRKLDSQKMILGDHELNYDTSELTSGFYFLRLVQLDSHKMSVVKLVK